MGKNKNPLPLLLYIRMPPMGRDDFLWEKIKIPFR
jgi:hypothetical protein